MDEFGAGEVIFSAVSVNSSVSLFAISVLPAEQPVTTHSNNDSRIQIIRFCIVDFLQMAGFTKKLSQHLSFKPKRPAAEITFLPPDTLINQFITRFQ